MSGYVWPPTRRLEAIAREIAMELDLPLGERFPMSRFAFAAPLGDHVLKITPPEDDQADHEPDALAMWDGIGAARVLWQDRERRAMVLERIRPGYDASAVAETEAVEALLGVGGKLWRSIAPGQFRSARIQTKTELERYRGTDQLVDLATHTFERIRPASECLLHGDLHHHNLLKGPEGWVAVDPKPLVGDREFDVAAFLWNPVGVAPTRERTTERLAAFAAGGLDPERLRGWAIVRGVLWDLPFKTAEELMTSRARAVLRHILE